jgi:hypothetical protein
MGYAVITMIACQRPRNSHAASSFLAVLANARLECHNELGPAVRMVYNKEDSEE